MRKIRDLDFDYKILEVLKHFESFVYCTEINTDTRDEYEYLKLSMERFLAEKLVKDLQKRMREMKKTVNQEQSS